MAGKKFLTISFLITTLMLVGCEARFTKGDFLYSENFEIIRTIDRQEEIYEVREVKTGIHYILNWYDGSFSPYYEKNKEIKQTIINEKYKRKE